MQPQRPELPVDAAQRVDVACDRFEMAWQRGEQPRIEDHLGGKSPQELAELLRELVALDVHYRRQRGEQPSASDYLGRFPGDSDAVHAAFGTADPVGDGLIARASGLLARFGAPVRFAAKAVLGVLVPGLPAAVELVGELLGAADPASSTSNPSGNASPVDRQRAAELMAVLATELGGLVGRVAALEGQSAAANRVIDAALASDPGCRAGLEKLAKAGLAADARTLGLTAPVGGTATALEVTEGPHQGLRFEYDRHDTLLVGRGTAANLQLLNDAHFSRHHFLLEFNPPQVYLRDLASSNGTKVNGKVVKECFLNDGDVISGGKTSMKITLPQAPIAVPVTRTRPPVVEAKPDSLQPTGAYDYAAPPPEDLPGYIPGYEVIRKLGVGGMGAVYLARHKGTGQEFALKLMLPESAASERAMQLFLREVSILSKLNHPNVVRYHEMGSALGQVYFAMEYVPCTPLAEQAAARTPERRVPFVCAVLASALDGLTYAHNQGFVHRDFKPANLLVDATGPTPRVKVSDFGLAKSFQNAGFSGMTHSGQAMGTLAYMAPEQLTNCRDAKPAADIYAVGATAYALLAGRPPLDVRAGRDPVRVLLEDDPPSLLGLCPWVPPGLAAIIHRALKKNPADRFANAPSLRSALSPFMSLEVA